MSGSNGNTPTRGVPLQLDKLRHLRYSLATLRKVRERFGDALTTGDISDDDLGLFLHYGLAWEDPELTVAQVEEEIDLENITLVNEALAKATGQTAKGSSEGNAPGPPQKRPRRTKKTTT